MFAAVFTACTNAPEVTVRTKACAPMPSPRATACACVCEGKAYVFAGRDANKQYLNDLWQYDPQTDSWTGLGQTPMSGRVNAVITAVGDKLYAGLGYKNSGVYTEEAYLRDWWEYTPQSKTWRRLADFPNANTVATVSFALNGEVYVIYGFGWGFTREIMHYDIAADTWTKQEDKGGRAKANFGGRGAWCGGLFYYGTGYNTSNLRDWWSTDITSEQWTQRTSIPGKGRQFSACAATDEQVYLFGGQHFGGDLTGGEIFNTYLRYRPAKDQWEYCGTMPCGRAVNQIAFTIDNKVYFGLGEDEKGQILNQLYCIED